MAGGEDEGDKRYASSTAGQCSVLCCSRCAARDGMWIHPLAAPQVAAGGGHEQRPGMLNHGSVVDGRTPVPVSPMGRAAGFAQQSLLLLEVLETAVLPSPAQLTLPSPDPEDGCLLAQAPDGLPQALRVHPLPCQDAQELLVVLGLVILMQQLINLKET